MKNRKRYKNDLEKLAKKYFDDFPHMYFVLSTIGSSIEECQDVSLFNSFKKAMQLELEKNKSLSN